MYIPGLYRISDPATIAAFLNEHDFATLVSAADGTPVATHLPLLAHCEEANRWRLTGHMARANPHWRHLSAEQEALAIFTGPDAYISPRWYHHVNVPTWNYQAAHVYGRPSLITEPAALWALLKPLVDRYEAQALAEPRYQMERLPADFVERQLQAIVGIELEVTRVEVSFKLSQNRDAADYEAIIAELEAREDEGSRLVARAMRRQRPAQ